MQRMIKDVMCKKWLKYNAFNLVVCCYNDYKEVSLRD